MHQKSWDNPVTPILSNFNKLDRLPGMQLGHYFKENYYFIEYNALPENLLLQKNKFHTNLLQAVDCIESNNKYYVVYPFIQNKYDLMKLEYNDKYTKIKQIVDVIRVLHDENLIHGDIQRRNILIDEDIHLIDLETLSINDTISTQFLKVPELVYGGNLNKKTDIYMLCLLIYEVLNESVIPILKTPLASICYYNTLQPVRNRLNKTLFDVIQTGLSPNPLERKVDVQEIYNSF